MPETKPTLVEQASKELERVEREPGSHATIDVNTEGVSGEVEIDAKRGWTVVGYGRYYWDKAKGWVAGGRATKRW